MPVLGLIFLRHACNRFQKVKVEVEKTLPSHPQRSMRALTKQDFEEQNSMFLPPEAQFDYLVALPESADIGESCCFTVVAARTQKCHSCSTFTKKVIVLLMHYWLNGPHRFLCY